MLRHCLRAVLLVLIGHIAMAGTLVAKPVIDRDAIKGWSSPAEPCLSDSGRYAAFALGDTIVLKSVQGDKERRLFRANGTPFFFLRDFLVYSKSAETLSLVRLDDAGESVLTGIRSWKIPDENPHGVIAYLADRGADNRPELIVFHCDGLRKQSFGEAGDFFFSGGGRLLATVSADSRTVTLTELVSGESRPIWAGKEIAQFSPHFDESERRLAFFAPGAHGAEPILWYFERGMPHAMPLIEGAPSGLDPGWTISPQNAVFDESGRRLFVEVHPPEKEEPLAPRIGINIWTYKDAKLRPDLLGRFPQTAAGFIAVVRVSDGHVVRLTGPNQSLCGSSSHVFSGRYAADYVFVATCAGERGEWNWNPSALTDVTVVSLQDGSVRPFLRQAVMNSDRVGPWISASGHIAIWFDSRTGRYLGLDLISGEQTPVAQDIPYALTDEGYADISRLNVVPAGLAGWVGGHDDVLLYDDYDVWRVDPTGHRPSVCLTHGFGRAHGIKMRLLDGSPRVHPADVSLLLTAFDTTSKETGFCRARIDRSVDPELLAIGPYNYCHLSSQSPRYSVFTPEGFLPLKARDANVWLVRRMSTAEAPNFFATSDFKNFRAMTEIDPERNYNWMTASLIHWTMPDGSKRSGILYKPEDFDATRRYPVILNYYKTASDGLYDFHPPQTMRDSLDLATFVSRGYLVCRPDIINVVGHNEQGPVDAIVSCAGFLAQQPYIDPHRIGLQGHSYGGYETNAVLTHSHLFSCAAEMAGVSDLVSSYLQFQGPLGDHSGVRYPMYEVGAQGGMDGSPWSEPEAYMAASPIHAADQITTPVLIVHNEHDGAVPFEQGVELFLALRRLQKKAWMLAYDGEGHSVRNEAAADYSTRLLQFFDYYLKGARPPRWMTEGVSPNLKGRDLGLELDPTGREP